MEIQLSIIEVIGLGLFVVATYIIAYRDGLRRGREAGFREGQVEGGIAAQNRIEELEDARVRAHLELASWRRTAVDLSNQLEKAWTRLGKPKAPDSPVKR